jgi:hypothetical protein
MKFAGDEDKKSTSYRSHYSSDH